MVETETGRSVGESWPGGTISPSGLVKFKTGAIPVAHRVTTEFAAAGLLAEFHGSILIESKCKGVSLYDLRFESLLK